MILVYMFLKQLKMVNFPLGFSEFYFSVLSSSSRIFIIAILSTAITAYIFLAAGEQLLMCIHIDTN